MIGFRLVAAGATALVALGMGIGVQPALAVGSGPYNVNDTTDAAQKGTAGAGNCQSTNADSCTLRAAVQAANQAGGIQVINLQVGATYSLSLDHTSSTDCSSEDGRDGDLHITSSLTINGNGATIQGKSGWTDRIILIGSKVQEAAPAISVTLNNLTIRNGHTSDVPCNTPHGGGLRNRASGVTTLNGVTVQDSTTANSGARDFNGNPNGGGGEGGGIHNDSGQMVLNNVTVRDNIGHSEGGGIANEDKMSLSSVAISGNDEEPPHPRRACGSGGMLNDGQAMLTNVTFFKNSAKAGAGGYTECNKSTLTNLTLSGNSTNCANCGDNLAAFTTTTDVTATNIILANPGSNGNCGTASGMNPTGDGGHNLSTDATCGFSGARQDIVGVDPLLGPFQLNPPGTTMTMAIAAPSRAVDAGDVSACPATDQRGVARKTDGACDIGAFESRPAAVPALPPTGTSRPVTTSLGWIALGAITALTALLAAVGPPRLRRLRPGP